MNNKHRPVSLCSLNSTDISQNRLASAHDHYLKRRPWPRACVADKRWRCVSVLILLLVVAFGLPALATDSNCCVVGFSGATPVPTSFTGSYGSYTIGVCRTKLCLSCGTDVTSIGVNVSLNVSCVTNIASDAGLGLKSPTLGFRIVQIEDTPFAWRVEPAGSFSSLSAGTLTVYTTAEDGTEYTGTIEVTKEEDCPTCPGEGCSGGGEAGSTPIIGSTSTGNSSVAINLRLGKFAFGKSAGALAIKELYPTNMLSTPSCLAFRYLTNSDCEIINNAYGIRQVKVPEGLANIITNTACKYNIEIYHPSVIGSKYTNSDCTGCYTNTGPPLQTITVENPDPTGNTTNKIRVTDGWGMVSDYEYKTNGWQLVKGGGAYKKNRTTNWSTNNTTKTNMVEIRNDADILISRETNIYQVVTIGTNQVEQLIHAAKGDGTNAITTWYSYYQTSNAINGFLCQVTNSNGRWEYFEYHTNGLKTNVCMAFLNQAPTNNSVVCRSISYLYGSNVVAGSGDNGTNRGAGLPRCTIEYVQGKEVGRYYLVMLHAERREIRCTTPGAAWDNTNNLVKTIKWYDSGTNLGRFKSIEHPDGTMQLFSYAFTNISGQAYRTNIVLSGVPDAVKTNITDGTKLIEVVGGVGQRVSETVIDILSGITLSQTTYTNYDSYNRPKTVTFLDGTSQWTDYGCCGAITETNREGTPIFHYLDAVSRRAATKMNNITQTNVFDAAGHVVSHIRIGTNGNQITKATYTYDTAGRMLTSKDALGNTNTYSEIVTNAQITRTTTYPDGGIRVEKYYRDGQLESVTGTAVHPMRYEYGVENDGSSATNIFTKEIKLTAAGADTSEWTKTYRDMVSRTYKTVYSDGATRQSSYNIKGQLVKEMDPDGVTMLHQYNARGEREFTATDMNRNGTIDLNGTDRITRTTTIVANNGVKDVTRTLSYLWATNNSAISNLASVTESATDGTRTWGSSFGITNQSRTLLSGSGNRYVTNTAPDGSFSISYFKDGQLQSLTRKDSTGNQLSQTTYTYDPHGRQYTLTDARNGTTTYAYNDADRATSVTTPAPGTGQSPQTTSHTYDFAGRLTRTVLADGAGVTNKYQTTGELTNTAGARIYPVSYAYDAQGRRTSMTTWQNYANHSGAATTTWNYDTNRGFLLSKVYNDGKGTTNAYTPAGRLRTRTWARGITTTYETNAASEIAGTTYSDGTSNVTYNLDRLGRRTNIVDGAGSRFLTYTDSGALLSETNVSGTLVGVAINYKYDQFLRRTNLTALSSNSQLQSAIYVYDGASRLTNASDGTFNAAYSYLANSPLVSQIGFRSNSTTRMTTTKQYDYLNRLLSISSQPSAQGQEPLAFSYSYNDANQRIRCTMPDSSFWLYEYDKLGQLTSGKRYWQDGTPIAGQQFEYAYDDIGNRSSTKAGGNENGAGLRSASYTANSLNQYSSRDVPGGADIIGVAHPSASVTVNGSSTYRKGEYFWKEMSIDNEGGPVWQSVTNIASLSGTNQTNTGRLFLPMYPEGFTYDLDGNLTSDGRWTNIWDAENRLIQVESLASGPTASKRKAVWQYDGQGRRVRQTSYDGSSGSYVITTDLKLVSDGWHCIAELNATNDTRLRSYLWGLDLSGSTAGAGGVGGLLAMNSASSGSHFYAMDGNGNVAALVSGSDGTRTVNQEYDPFGQTVRLTGTAVAENPYRFSTKRANDSLDLVSYEYRTHNPVTGKWLNRDPIGEQGGINLYAVVKNEPLNIVDILGLDYHETSRDDTLANIQSLYGVNAYTGDANSVGIATPHPVPTTHHIIIMQGCCASINRAQQVDVNVLTVLPNDAVGVAYTSIGFGYLQGHEGSRRTAYSRAYDAYIDPIQGIGSRVRRCPTICRANARSLLVDYLNANQTAGIDAFNNWVDTQQTQIGMESLHWILVGGLRDHLDWTYSIPNPPPLQDIPCPHTD